MSQKKKKKTIAYHDLADIDGFWGHKHESYPFSCILSAI